LAKAVMSAVDLQPIDRLEDKVKLLIGMIDRLRADGAKASDENARLRADSAKTADDNARLTRDVEAMRSKLQEAEGLGPELVALREERTLIRSRVGEMLEQIESLNL